MLHHLSCSDIRHEEDSASKATALVENVVARKKRRDETAAATAAARRWVHTASPPHLGGVQSDTTVLLFSVMSFVLCRTFVLASTTAA